MATISAFQEPLVPGYRNPAGHQREGESGRLYHFFSSHPQTRLHISKIRKYGKNKAHKAKRGTWSTFGKSKWQLHPSKWTPFWIICKTVLWKPALLRQYKPTNHPQKVEGVVYGCIKCKKFQQTKISTKII